jgi:hypothetical protein
MTKPNLNRFFDRSEHLIIRIYFLARLVQDLWHHWRT